MSECENKCQCDQCQGVKWPPPRSFSAEDEAWFMNTMHDIGRSAAKRIHEIMTEFIIKAKKPARVGK